MVCLAFGGDVLTFIKSTVLGSESSKSGQAGVEEERKEEEGPRIWRLVFEVGKGVKMRLLDEEEKRKVGEGRAEVEGGRWGFLPGWVKTWRAKKEVDG
jgi:hypothetical protein